MTRFTRFVVHQRIGCETRQMGLFSAAYFLRDDGELNQHERDNLDRLLKWFESELSAPPQGIIDHQAIFWYKFLGPFAKHMWELVEIIREHNFTAELITSNFIGRVIYEDKHQYAAIPPRKRPRIR